MKNLITQKGKFQNTHTLISNDSNVSQSPPSRAGKITIHFIILKMYKDIKEIFVGNKAQNGPISTEFLSD